MQRIPITLAKPGMKLAKEVFRPENPSGPAMCGKGMELTESLLGRLRNMGILSITVQGHPVWIEGDSSLEEMLGELDKRFSQVAEDPLAGTLKKVYREYLLRSMGE